MQEVELKPCPFCGGNAEQRKNRFIGWEYWIQCTKCGATTKSSHYEKLASEVWNRRA